MALMRQRKADGSLCTRAHTHATDQKFGINVAEDKLHVVAEKFINNHFTIMLCCEFTGLASTLLRDKSMTERKMRHSIENKDPIMYLFKHRF